MKTRFALIVFVLSFAFLAESHEMWMQTRKFRFAVAEEATISFLVGENFEGEDWGVKREKIEKLESHHLTKTTDLRSLLKPESKEKLKVKFTEEGTHLLAMQSTFASIELDAEKFNAYLEEDGLEDVIEWRKKNNAMGKSAKERYARYVKLLVQAGTKTDDTFKKKIGHRLEIVPLANPYQIKNGDYLGCQIFFDGKPAAHQLVKIWNKIGTSTILQNTYSENDGTIKFPISSKGPWMVSTVKMIASEKPEADWQSMWASFVFGIE